jgi:hypothetical protein
MKFMFNFITLLITLGSTQFAFSKSKYGELAKPLSAYPSSLRSNEAHPDFWSLIPFYVSQRDEKSCSLASLTTVLNAALRNTKTRSDQPYFTQDSLLKFSDSALWKKNLGPKGQGVTLHEIKTITEELLKKLNLKNASVTLFQPGQTDQVSLTAFRRILIENEKSDQDFIIVNYVQGLITQDSQTGHLAPIGAYNESKKEVLILDPDRQWYEPYWTKDENLLKAMATVDPVSQKQRGLIWIRLND